MAHFKLLQVQSVNKLLNVKNLSEQYRMLKHSLREFVYQDITMTKQALTEC